METFKRVSEIEKIDLKTLKERIERGEIVILKNRVRNNVVPVGIGKDLRTKVNTNIGTSPEKNDLEFELKKLKIAIEAGTDTVMDLSTAGDLDLIRNEIIKKLHYSSGNCSHIPGSCGDHKGKRRHCKNGRGQNL